MTSIIMWTMILLKEHLGSIVSTIVLLRVVDWIIKRKRFIASVNKLPGLPLDDLHPFFGHIDTLVATRGQIPDRPGIPTVVPWFLARVPEFARKYGVMRLWFFHPYRVPFARASLTVLDPELAQQILLKMSKHIVKEKRAFKIASAIFGNSFILLPDGPVWKHQRKMTALAFHQDLLQNVCTTVYELLVKHVFPVTDEKPQVEAVEAMEWSARLTTEVLGLVGFSHSFGSFDHYHTQSDEMKQSKETTSQESLFDIFTTILMVISERILSPPILHWTRFKQNRKFRKATGQLDSVIGGIVKDRMQKEIEKENQTKGKEVSTDTCNRGKDILAGLLRPDDDGKRLSYNEIFGNVRMFLFAGHDTTAATVAWAFWELSCHPKVQQKLQEEVDSLFDSQETPESVPDYNQMAQLKYLDAVMKETLRLHSPAPVARSCSKDMTLKRGGQTFFIPADTTVFMFPLYMQLMEAADFRPERFLDDKGTAPTYMPFSIGPRSCVGAPMAVAEIKAILCHILRRYTIRPSANAVTPIPVMMLTMKPHKVLVDLVARNQRSTSSTN